MWIPIITSLVCFAVATILFTPPLRKFPFYQAVSFYFLFEGAWTLFNTLITAIWPYADFMIWVSLEHSAEKREIKMKQGSRERQSFLAPLP